MRKLPQSCLAVISELSVQILLLVTRVISERIAARAKKTELELKDSDPGYSPERRQ